MFFYFDEKVKAYEEHFQWDKSLIYLETLYLQNPEIPILNALIGYSWLYFVEGPIISGEYEDDVNTLPLEYWKKYVDVGMDIARNNPYFNFIAGYTLSLDGYYLGSTYEQLGNLLMKICMEITDDLKLKDLANNFIKNTSSKEYMPVSNGDVICSRLFYGGSLLDQYFCEIYMA